MPTAANPFVGQDWRLLHAIALNAIVIACAWRFVRRRGGNDALAAAPWALTLWLLVQYLSVSIPAICCVLNRWSISVAAIIISAALWIYVPKQKTEMKTAHVPVSSLDRFVAWGATLFLGAYLVAIVVSQWSIPPMGDDGLMYHLPAAVRWLRAGRFVFNDIWFLNPAATYAPLLGSTLAAWWMAPMGHDLLAKFMQVPALVLLFFALLQLCRVVGARTAVAALVALAAVVSKPFINQILVVKDDLYLTGFFLMIVIALLEGAQCGYDKKAPDAARPALNPWALGIAAGMFLATKITSLMAVPMLLLAIDVPFRAGWRLRHFAIAAAVAIVLAGPWYIHNLIVTGNPLYPADISFAGIHLSGLFKMSRSIELRSVSGIWHVLTGAYFSMPPWMFLILVGAWLGAIGTNLHQIVRQPVARLPAFGPVIGMAVYLAMCQFPEVRYAYPAFALLFAAAAALASRWNRSTLPTILAGILVLVSAETAIEQSDMTPYIAASLAGALLGVAIVWAQSHFQRLVGRILTVAGVAAVLSLWVWAYIYMDARVYAYSVKTEAWWEARYELAPAWSFIRGKAPRGSTIAYTNTCLVYPLFGFQWDHDVVYAPLRSDIHSLGDLPRVSTPLPGEQMVEFLVAPLMQHADREVWLRNLDRTGARYLFIAKKTRGVGAVELDFANRDPDRFAKLFDNEFAAVYEIRRRTFQQGR